MKMRVIITVIVLSFFHLATIAQLGTVRIELDAEYESDIYFVVPCDDKGVLLIYETQQIKNNMEKEWLFKFYDSDLIHKWDQTLPVLIGADYHDYVVKDDKVYLFFLNTGKVKTEEENFQMVHFKVTDTVMRYFKGTVSDRSTFFDFQIMNDLYSSQHC